MRAPETNRLIQAIHDSPRRGVIAVTGGGSAAISDLLAVPGASRTVLEAVVPYAEAALAEWVRGRVDSACSEPTARAMAMAAFERARVLVGDDPHAGDKAGELFGVGCTASLASDRSKRGDHRLHVAVQTHERTLSWSVTLAKGKRTRAEEEAVAADAVLHAVAVGCGVATADAIALGPDDSLTQREKWGSPLWKELLVGDGMTALVDPTVDHEDYTDNPRCDRVLLPGAFDPAHHGHREMAFLAARKLGKTVTLELSISNVDKPPLDYLAIDERLRSIVDVLPEHEVWLTRRPTFLGKARALGAVTFVVGVDTITRIADARYYGPRHQGGDAASRDAAIAELAERGCRFLVLGRVEQADATESSDGERTAGRGFLSLDAVALPDALRAICDGVHEEEFRQDVSSTDLRSQRPT